FLFLVDLVQLLIVAVVGLLEVVFEFLFVLEFLVFVEFVVLEELVVLFAVAVLLNFVVRRGLELVVAGKSLLTLHGRLGWISWRFAPFMLPGLLMYCRAHRCAATSWRCAPFQKSIGSIRSAHPPSIRFRPGPSACREEIRQAGRAGAAALPGPARGGNPARRRWLGTAAGAPIRPSGPGARVHARVLSSGFGSVRGKRTGPPRSSGPAARPQAPRIRPHSSSGHPPALANPVHLEHLLHQRGRGGEEGSGRSVPSGARSASRSGEGGNGGVDG